MANEIICCRALNLHNFNRTQQFLDSLPKRVLFISNGHGEDLNASEVIKALNRKYPQIETAAMPMVGEGSAYRRLGVPIIGPTQHLTSGGFVYMDSLKLADDFKAGLLQLTWQQVRAIRTYSKTCDLILATGDIVVLAAACFAHCPYASFIVSASGLYEGIMKPPFLTDRFLRSPRCKIIFTRDAFTAKLMNQQGIAKAVFAGYPIMDVLAPTGKDLNLIPNVHLIAFLPGSRLPEAVHNLGLMLNLAIAITKEFAPAPVQFRAALVPSTMQPDSQGQIPVRVLAQEFGWEYKDGQLHNPTSNITVACHSNAFPDILHQCNLAVGMAGTAVEQAVGLGKPVIQICGHGPQFTYQFAEAQMRLLGLSVQTIGNKPADQEILQVAAEQIRKTLGDQDYLQACQVNGLERVGESGGAEQIGDHIASYLWSNQCN